jgi:very-short-patch-repair endonuclease
MPNGEKGVRSDPIFDIPTSGGVPCRVWPEVVALAGRQRALVTRRQLLALGVDVRTIKRWLAAGLLHPVQRGVYAVGHDVLVPLAREMGAVLACGDDAVLSHRSAAEVWGLLPAQPGPRHVTVPSANGRSRRGLVIHRVQAVEATKREGIPITTPAQTIRDLAATEPERVVERALNEALVQRLISSHQLPSPADERPRRGKARLERVLSTHTGPSVTRSEAEQQTKQLIRRAGLPTPQTNAKVHGYEVDFLWPDHGFGLEVDGYAYHSTRSAFERDRDKDAHLETRGIEIARVTWRQLTERPEAVVARIARGLAR